MRRIVTGTNADGKAAIVSDSEITADTLALMPGAGFLSIWGGDAAPTLPTDGAPPKPGSWFPPATGYRVQMITIPPAKAAPAADPDMAAALAQANAKVPGLMDHMDPDHPGMHQTDTVDFVYVVSGRCVLELADGARTDVKAGDIVVQNGTRHAWRVPCDEPCTVLSISLGAERKGQPRQRNA